MAPEILKRLEYNYKCDLWSIGIIIYKLIFCKSPFSGETETSLINNIENLGNKYLKKIGNKNLDDLIEKLLEKDKKNRLNWDEYLNHPFFNNDSKNNINLIYEIDYKGSVEIFGNDFVKNNKNNIKLIINGVKSEITEYYELRKGKNNIELIIKNKLTSLEDMFGECSSIKNIEELKYLDTTEVNNFSRMFYECSSPDIKGLENLNVSNGNNFSQMFMNSKISNLKILKNWNVSKGKDFFEMFRGCPLSNLIGLEKWNVSNGNNFSRMFC